MTVYTGFTLYLVSKPHQTFVEEKEHSLSVLNFYISGIILKNIIWALPDL